jgi:hypothetical protein
MSREGEKYNFQKGGGINIVFGPKYRPLNFNFSSNPFLKHFGYTHCADCKGDKKRNKKKQNGKKKAQMGEIG